MNNNIAIRENGFEILFNTADKELNELVRVTTKEFTYIEKDNTLIIHFNLLTDNIEKLRGLRTNMIIPLNIILMDPTCTIKYNLFDKDKNFEITNCFIHMDYDNAKVAQYVITLNKVKL